MSELFDRLVSYIKENNRPVFSITMMSDNETENAVINKTNRCQNSYSVAKAFVVTAVGIMYDRGLLKLEDRVTDILSRYLPEKMDERWHKITVRDALLHRMGLPKSFLDIDVYGSEPFGRDFLNYMFSTELVSEPCVERCYTDGAYYLLSRVVEEVGGEPTDDLLWKELFLPMNYTEMAWSHCPMGHPMGATGLYITSKDMAKLGELYRHGGVYNGQRILSEDFVSHVLTEGFELRKTGIGVSYAKGGMYGQELCVFPDKGLTVAWHAFGYKDKEELLHIIEGDLD
ncbi:MAG: beta-lactamase family protein [Clostridia bacterium]|nr:beta-lactamase family protein [Clostridia bacterium]